MYNKRKCEDMRIESLQVSADALEGLKRGGVTWVSEIVDYLAQTWGGRGSPGRINYKLLENLPEIVDQLKAVGCWPDDLEDIEM